MKKEAPYLPNAFSLYPYEARFNIKNNWASFALFGLNIGFWSNLKGIGGVSEEVLILLYPLFFAFTSLDMV